MNYKINESIFDKFPNLETERLLLRNYDLKDAKDLFQIRSNEEVMKYMDTNYHNSVADSEKLIGDVLTSFENKTGISWIVEEKKSKEAIGYIGYWRLIKENVRAEIGYALKPNFWGNGYMKEALNKVLDFGFNELKLHSIEGNVNPNNANSTKLLERIGFRKEASFREDYLFNGKFIDSEIYCMLETDL